jgi:hypothetical protein
MWATRPLSENGRVVAGEQHGNGMGTACERHGMCELAFNAAGERHGVCKSSFILIVF